MPVDIDEVLSRSDEVQIAFLTHCVFNRRLEPLFVFLVNDYRDHPSLAKAHALHQVFCRAGAPVRLETSQVLSPADLRIERRIGSLPRPPAVFVPDRTIFDSLVTDLRREGGPIAEVTEAFDPALDAEAHLPGGRIADASQRAFVEGVWRPTIRPQLRRAGFWRVATLGG